MPAKWADVLVPGSAVREEFEKLLSQRIEQDFEPEDELNSCVLDALLEVEDKESLNAELQEVFEDQAASISDWCWETLQQLTVRENQPSAPGTPATPPDSSPAAGSADEHQNEQQGQQVKRAPIRFNLESSAPETAPKKATDDKAQQLGGRKPAAAQQPAKQASDDPPAAAQQPSRTEQQPAKTAAGSAGSGSASTRQRGAPAASARLLHMTGLIRSTDGSAGSGARESRAWGSQQDQREQQPRTQEQSRSPQQQQQQQSQQRKRVLDEPQGPEAGRSAPGASRRGPASVVAGAGSMFRNAMDGLKSGGRAQDPAPQQQQQQQQPAGGTSVFARIAKDDLARLGVPQPQQQQQQQQQPGSKQAPASRQQEARQQPNQQQGLIDGLPKSLQGRLGIMPGRTSAAAAQGASTQSGRPKASPSAAPSFNAAGAKRKADAAQPAATPAAVAAAAAAPKAAAPSSAAAAVQQQDPQQGAPAKKTRTAAPAAGSKEAELAALRAQLEARQAEVQRLKQAQEADQVSVAVFGVLPRVPDTVLMAHFRSCAQSCGANIRRCTMLAGRFPPHVTAPGAYVEFEGMGGDAAARAKAAQQATTNALQLSGSMLLDQKITVVRKADWQANQAKGQRVYTAARTGAAQPVGAGSRSWKGPSSGGAAAATAGGAATAATAAAVMPSNGVAES